jgi:hypothetical protein
VIRFLGLRRKHPYADYFERGDDTDLGCVRRFGHLYSPTVVA